MVSRSQLVALAVLTGVVTLSANQARARSRLLKLVSTEQGLLVPDVRDLAQDRRGFIWIATAAGLARFDGRELVSWAPDVIDKILHKVTTSPNGDVLVSVANGPVFQVTSTGAANVVGPDGKPLANIVDMEFDDEGVLWVIKDRQLWQRPPTNKWRRTDALAPIEKERPAILKPAGPRTMYVGTHTAVWRIVDGKVERIAPSAHRVVAIALEPDANAVHFLSFMGNVVTADAAGVRPRFSMRTRGTDLIMRQGTLWVGYDSHLVALRRDRDPEKIAMHVDQFMIDREGSLWLATMGGLKHFPEPETAFWDRSDGLRKAHVRYIANHGDDIYFSMWNEPVQYIDHRRGRLVALGKERNNGQRPCVDGNGVLWIAGHDMMRAVKGVDIIGTYHEGTQFDGAGCSRAPNGGVWMGTRSGLFWIAKGGEPVYRGSLPGTKRRNVSHPFEDSHGTLWASVSERICSVSAADARGGAALDWTCTKAPGIWYMRSMMETRAGALLATTAQGGVIRHVDGAWRPVRGAKALVGMNTHSIRRARKQGFWITAVGQVMRVALERGGLRVLERLSRWNGLRANGAIDIHEDSKGTVWLATGGGVAQVPLSARSLQRRPPPVTLIQARVQGRSVLLDGAVTLPYGDNHAELVLAGPAFRDPSLTRFRVRLGASAKWSQPSAQPVFNFVDLPPGNYRVDIAATIDGKHWSTTTRAFEFRVARPWFQEPWVWLIGGMLILGLFALFHRARMAVRLRLERQRTRIAMDLHDEMGSGLGSIGLLAELSADCELEPSEQQAVAGKIQHAASSLGGSLTDIVWSLREHSGEPARLAAYLRARGHALFPKQLPQMTTDFPETWPAVELSLPVRRALQLIALEAMYNAAKHANAAVVTLGIRADGAQWTLWVEDDGVGINEEAKPRLGGGIGMNSMRKRADSIGAKLTIGPGATTGTRVELIFAPKAEDRRLGRGKPDRPAKR